jgi:hypothetical protein
MKFLSHRVQRFLLAIAVLMAASSVSSPAQGAATKPIRYRQRATDYFLMTFGETYPEGGAITSAPDPQVLEFEAPLCTTFRGWRQELYGVNDAISYGPIISFPYSPTTDGVTLLPEWTPGNCPTTPGATPNSLVATIPLTGGIIAATASLPSFKFGFAATSGQAEVTVAPTVNPATPINTPFAVTASTKIVDINVTGVTGDVTVCVDGDPTDHIFHFSGGEWVKLAQRSYVDGRVCGVTSSFSPFTAATPMSPPSAPTNLSATRGDKALSVSFTPGANNGAAISNYEYSIDNGATWKAMSPSVVSSPVVISGLTNGTDYPVKLRAVNIKGSGASSEASTGRPASAPTAPTSLVVARGDASLSISFTAGANNGDEIIRYEYLMDSAKTWTKVPGGDVKSPIMISGLKNGTTYSVSLRAVNSVGSGAGSTAVTGKPQEPLLADSSGIDVPIVKDPALTFALKSDIAVKGNKVAVALVAPTKAKDKISYYVFTMKPKTKGAATVKQTYKAKAKGTTTAILTGKPKVTYTVSVTAIYTNGSRKSWTGPSLATE